MSNWNSGYPPPSSSSGYPPSSQYPPPSSQYPPSNFPTYPPVQSQVPSPYQNPSFQYPPTSSSSGYPPPSQISSSSYPPPSQYPPSYQPMQPPPNYGGPPPSSAFFPTAQHSEPFPRGSYYRPDFMSQFQRFAQDQRLREWFDRVDVDRNGYIDREELREAFRIAGKDCSSSNVDYMFQMYDRDNNQGLDFEEFAQLWGYVESTQNSYHELNQYDDHGVDFNTSMSVLKSKIPFLNQMGWANPFFQQAFDRSDKKKKGRLNMKHFLLFALIVASMVAWYEKSKRKHGSSHSMLGGPSPYSLGSMSGDPMSGGHSSGMAAFVQNMMKSKKNKKHKKKKKDKYD